MTYRQHRQQASRQHRQATASDPERASNLVTVEAALAAAIQHHQAGRLQQAEAIYRKVLEARPRDPFALHHLGVIALQAGENETAVDLIGKAIASKPDYAEAHSNVGVALINQGKLEQGVACHQKAIALKPEYAEAHHNLGGALLELHKFDEAAAAYEKAIELKPGTAESHHNLGHTLKQLGRFDETRACYQRTIALKPGFADAHLDLGKALILGGQMEEGWAECEWRWEAKNFPPQPRNFTQPLWDGSRIEGKTILVHAEPGFGDTMHFVRYAPMAAACGGRVVVECQRQLRTLFAGIDGIDEVVCRGDPLPAFDLHCPFLSMPHALGTTLETIPADIPYLKPDPGKLGAWRSRLGGANEGLKVGLAWAGHPGNEKYRTRAIALQSFEPLLTLESVDFFSLQIGTRAADIAACGLSSRITDLAPYIDDFSDTAAAVSLLDLVISIDTSVAHLTGALGKPIWTLITFVPDWRWMLEREDSPWYPTMRLFRQAKPLEWEPVIERVRAELARVPAGSDGALAHPAQTA